MNLNTVQENGQVRSFAELAGAALNFHKPGNIIIEKTFRARNIFHR